MGVCQCVCVCSMTTGDDVQPVEGEQHEEQSAQQVKSLKCDE